jgi:NAD(P)H-flavin reductase
MDVLCFVTGSGIASVRPVLEYWRTRETLAPDSVALYYGESDRRDFAYRENLAQWRDEGVRTFLCDGEGEGSSEFQHVQDAFREDDPDLERAVAFVAGAPVMKRPVIRLLIERGIPIDRIVINV